MLAVNYATNSFSYEEHSGANVPVFTNDVGIGRVSTMVTQPQLFEIMRDYLFQPPDPQTWQTEGATSLTRNKE